MKKIELHCKPWYTATGIIERICLWRAHESKVKQNKILWAGLYGVLEVFGAAFAARVIAEQVKANLPHIVAQYKQALNQKRRKDNGGNKKAGQVC